MGLFPSCAGPSTAASTRSSTCCPARKKKTGPSSTIRNPTVRIAIVPPDPASDAPVERPEPTTPSQSDGGRSQFAPVTPFRDLNDRLLSELIDGVKAILRKEASDRLRDVYLIGDIEKDTARGVIERMREMANDSSRPITLYINSAGGNVTDGLALHDSIRQLVAQGIEVTIV